MRTASLKPSKANMTTFATDEREFVLDIGSPVDSFSLSSPCIGWNRYPRPDIRYRYFVSTQL